MKKLLTILISIFTIIPMQQLTFACENVTKVNVKNKTMRVYTKGEGFQTIVLLSGFGTKNPIQDFKALADELSESFRVVVIEYFGYGDSEITIEERTNKVIVEEIRTALKKLNVKPPYILMPHSMSGLYCLYYSKIYPKEVAAVVGIDMSLPQKQLERFTKVSFEKTKRTLDNSGLNISLINQWNSFFDNSKELESVKFNKNLPVLLFLATEQIEAIDKMKESGEIKTPWFDMNKNMITNQKIQRIEILEGSHYLHHEQKDKIVIETKNFVESEI